MTKIRDTIEMIEGIRDSATITPTQILIRSWTRKTTDVITVVNLDTSELNAQRRGSPMTTGERVIRRTTARGITPLKVYPMFLFALNPCLLLLFRKVGL